ncbi:hypothetical protein [Pseudomonas sp. RT6P73]
MTAVQTDATIRRSIFISGKIAFDAPRRVRFESTSVTPDVIFPGLTINYQVNNNDGGSKRSAGFTLNPEIKTGTYNLKDGNFIAADYIEHLHRSAEAHSYQYLASEGTLTITVTELSSGYRHYDVTSFEVTAYSKFNEESLLLKGTFDFYIKEYPTAS